MSSGLKKVNSNLKGRPSTLWTMSVGCPGNGRQPLEEPYTVQWVRWPISYGDQPLTGEPDAGEPPVRFGGRGDSSIVPTPNRGNHRITVVPFPSSLAISMVAWCRVMMILTIDRTRP